MDQESDPAQVNMDHLERELVYAERRIREARERFLSHRAACVGTDSLLEPERQQRGHRKAN